MRHFLDQLFGSRTRAKVLRLMMTNPEKSYFVREISRKVGEHVNSVRRELSFLSEVDIVRAGGEGQKRYYWANVEYSLFPELKALIFKAQVLEERELLAAIKGSGRIHLLVLTGFFVNRPETRTDVLVVGTVNRRKLAAVMKLFQTHFDRDIHYTVLSRIEFEYRHSLTDRFLYDILDGPMIVVIDKRKSTKNEQS